MAYEIDYNDERFQQVEADKQAALTEVEKTYDGMIEQSDGFYNAQIDASQQWAETQQKNQQEQTDFAIEKIEQQKDKAHKDYLKEQSGAYVDYQKQSNAYGVNAEQMAASGMKNTGYSESSQVAMYNTYQNRVAMAKTSFNQVVLNYDNMVKEAILQNNSALAEIAFNTQKEQLELALQGFNHKNQLILDKANKKTEIDNTYHNRWQEVQQQINTENAFEEQIRQYEQNYALQNKQFEESIRQFDIEIARLKEQDAKDNAYKIQQLELQKAQLKEEQRQFNASLAEEKRQFNAKQSSDGVIIDSVKVKDDSNVTNNSQGGAPVVDMASVISLGYGPISATRLNQLVASGEIVEYEENGKLKYKKAK
ncbi:MAG: hypothetical protein IJA80_02510 [Clostridia bacterium]|nr:hypothetical protein [Clostridia bacterium]